MVYQFSMLFFCHFGIYNFFSWFIPFNYLFLFGRVFLIALGYKNELFWSTIRNYSDLACLRAGLFCLCYLQILFISLMTMKNNSAEVCHKNPIRTSYDFNVGINGLILFVVTMPFKIYTDRLQIQAQQSAGQYVVLGDVDAVTATLAMLPVVGVIMYIFSNKASKVKKISLIVIYHLYASIEVLFAGDRRQFVISIIVCILALCYYYHVKISWKMLLGALLVGVIGLFALAAIREGRLNVIYSFGDFVEVFNKSMQNNIIYETMSEFGLTFYSVVATIEFYPSRFSFTSGWLYIAMFVIIIPGVSSKIPQMHDALMVSKYCKSVYNHGLGGSIPQDLYSSFSVFGLVGAIPFTIIMTKILTIKADYNEWKQARYFILFYGCLNLVRCGIAEITRLLAYAFIIIWIINIIVKLFRQKFQPMNIAG